MRARALPHHDRDASAELVVLVANLRTRRMMRRELNWERIATLVIAIPPMVIAIAALVIFLAGMPTIAQAIAQIR